MKNIDVIFLSFSKNEELYSMTKNAICSLIENNQGYNFNICVVQTCDNKFGDKFYFDDDTLHVVHPNSDFHYNDFLRIGYQQMPHTSDLIMICNDDIYFQERSITELIKGLKFFTICSPKNPSSRFNGDLQSKHKSGYIKGYTTSEHISGWCHLIKKNIFNQIPLDIFWHKQFGGYYQDDWIAFLCKRNKIPIGLCADSIVEHNESTSSPHASNRKYFTTNRRFAFIKMKLWYFIKQLVKK